MDIDLRKDMTDNYSLRARVFHSIRENILNGVYQENEELREITLAQELGVSRTPVREALRQLELEGLVNIIPNKGAYVTGITKKDIHDIYSIRSYLEGLCARWACEHITENQIEELEEILYLSEFHGNRNHYDQLVELDTKFHEVIYRASGSKILDHVLSDFHHYVERVRKISLQSPSRAPKTLEEHTALVAAIKNRDGSLAERLATEHIMNTIKNMGEQGI